MSDFIITYFDQIALVGSLIVATIFIYPKFKAKLADGFQPATDIPEAIAEGLADYKSAFVSIEKIAKDVTINDADSLASIINIIENKKTFK